MIRPTRPCSLYTALVLLLSGALFYHFFAQHSPNYPAVRTKKAVQSYFSHSRYTDGSSQSDLIDLRAGDSPFDETVLDKMVRNRTLGFEKVFMLGLAERGDRRDAFTVAASLTGFQIDFLDGVDGATVPNKSVPIMPKALQDASRNARVGTWRAHVNIAQKMVREGIASAMIFEDDSDWDVTLKDRMVDFSHGSRYFSMREGREGLQPVTPYGDDWDMLWLGHCSCQQEIPQDGPRLRYLIENDPSTPYPENRVNFDGVPNMSMHPKLTRAVFNARSGVCLYGYALSYRGAQRILYAQSTLKEFAPVDIAYGDMCRDTENPFNCIGVFPQIIDTHKQAGTMDRDSNIGQYSHDDIRENGFTYNVRQSTRLNAMRLLTGQVPRSQWPEQQPQSNGVNYRLVDLKDEPKPNLVPHDPDAKLATDTEANVRQVVLQEAAEAAKPQPPPPTPATDTPSSSSPSPSPPPATASPSKVGFGSGLGFGRKSKPSS